MTDSPRRLSQRDLNECFVRALGRGCLQVIGEIHDKPLLLDLTPPLPSRVRVYIWNLTRPPGGRPADELKVQFIIPGQARGERASFDESGGRAALVVGYSIEDEVFVFWDASCYPDFAYSRNVQVKSDAIIAAYAGEVSTHTRKLRIGSAPTTETVVAAPSRLLREGLVLRDRLTRERLLADT
jgi:hypothetical protein